MRLIYTGYGYDFYVGIDSGNKKYYNIVSMGDEIPTSGYYNSDWICKIKGVKNVYKTFEKVETDIKNIIMDKLKNNGY